ncbi:TipJ family phage tail tip protein [Pseudomonas oryzihabitans]|uniref:TipJ family phage tail tip protein n=1 Tax=Pseudomonas oryzihabitans TaxID=47885 RepID=UPI0011A9671E|nr:phage tail protein [Pseudomonas oryzihabitans]
MGKHYPISGAKGSSKSAKSPTETPDSLISIAYAKVLDGISEGPIVGLVNGNQSIFLDKTPLANADGSLNFSNVTVATRTGEADQDYVPGFPSVESETAVGVELKASQAWVQSISNLDLSAVRVRLQVPYLSNTDSKGNINGYEVQYAIDVATDSGAYVEVLTSSFNGKTTTTYERSHRLELPAAKTGWRVRVRRLTADSTSSSIQSRTSIASYTEIIDAKLRYPYSAVVGITVDASQFSSIPARAFDVKLRIVRVPSNYNPETRNYAGTWDGTFKLAWTDNPAWIYYDLLLNDRYGLGALITAAQVDRWGLYQIARYCDEKVDDGKGGKEPRFACNVYLQTRAEALQVLQDLASVFRGMAYWAAGSVMAVADMPSDPVYTYNQANVIDGTFTYAGSAKSTRFTVALVSWNDPANFYEKKVEYVSDQKGLARYGVQQTELTAFGCTSQGQAQRLGHYTLLTNRLENETVTFSVGLDGTIARPGQIIRVADEARAGRRIGGRISASTTTTVTLDSDATVAAGDTLVVILPTGVAETRKVKAYADRVVTVTQAFSTAPIAQSVFAIETATLVPQTFRVLSVAEDFGQADLRYTITAVKHVAGKYAAIDSGAQIVTLPVTVIPSSVQAPPTNIQLSSYDSVDQGISISTLRATWEAPANAVSYDVWWRRDSNDWTYAGRCYTSSMEVRGVYAGTYMVRVAAINALDAASIWAYSQPTALAGKTGAPPALALLKTTAGPWKITLDWAFPAEGAGDSAYTEIQQATTGQGDNAQSMGLFAFPTNTYTLNGLAAGARLFFRGRLIDRIGNVGPWTNWTVGTASTDATEYNQLITEEFVHSALGQELFDRIDLVDASASVPGSVSSRIAETRSALQEEINAVQNQLDQIGDLADAQEYKKTEAYKAGAIVTVDNALFQAKKDVPAAADGSNAPPATAYWRDAGAIIREGDGLATRVTSTENTVSTQGGKITANSNDITQLKTSVSGKAESTTVQALQNQVTSQGNTVTAQGSAITNINVALGDSGSENLLYNPGFETWADGAAVAAGWYADVDANVGKTYSKVASFLNAQTFAQRMVLTSMSASAGAYIYNEDVRNKVVTGAQKLAASIYVKATAGAVVFMAFRAFDAAGNAIYYAEGTRVVADGTAQRLTCLGECPAATVAIRLILRVYGTATLSTVTLDCDNAQLQLGTTVTGWKDNNKTVIDSVAGQATATSQLAGRVTNVEGSLTSQASSITNLQSSLGNAGGENLIYNPAFTEPTPATPNLPLGWNTDGSVVDATTNATWSTVTSWLDTSQKAARIDFKGINESARYFSFSTNPQYRAYATAGQQLTCSGFVRGTPGIRMRIFIQAINSSGIAISAPVSNFFTLTAAGARVSFSAAMPDGTVRISVFFRAYSAADGNGDGYIEMTRAQLENGNTATGWKNNTRNLADKQDATSTALSGLTTTVNQQGSNITSQAGQITSLSTSIKGAVQQAFNMVPNPTFDPAFNTMGFYIVQTTAAGVPANCPFPYAARITARDNFPDINSLPNFPVKAGDVYRFSALVAAGANTGTRPFQHYATRATSPFGGRTAYQASQMTSVTQTWTRVTWDHTIPAGQTFLNPMLQIETLNAETATWYVTDWHCENITAAKQAQATADAAATATTNLGTRVTSAEGNITSQATQLTNLQAQIAGASTFSAAVNFEFLNSLKGAYLEQAASNATITAYQQNATFTGYANFRLPTFPATNGAQNYVVKMRIRRKNTTRAQGRIYWANEDGGLSEARTAVFNIDLNNPGWQDITIDLGANAAWSTKTGNFTIRFDFLNAQDTSAVVDIAYIAIGRPAAAASATALSDTQAQVTQQGATLTSQASSISTLQTSLGDTNASVQQVSQAQANTAGKVNASWAVKLGVTQEGTYYMAGIGVGIEPGGGSLGLQSTVAVASDRFLVLGPGIDGKGKAFFSVVNGQTFMDSAFINKAYISNALIGQTVQSQQLTSYNQPIRTDNYYTGEMIIRNYGREGRYLQINDTGVFLIADGVVLVEMSLS